MFLSNFPGQITVMKNRVPDMQDLGKKLVWGVSVDSVYVLFGESTCGFVWTVLAINTAVPT